MNEFRFANPNWIHSVWLLALAAVVVYGLRIRGRKRFARILSTDLQERLVCRPSRGRLVIASILMTLAFLSCTVAMMRPQWGKRTIETSKVESQIMICLDVSKSMLAEDVVPSRLERAKLEIDSLLSLTDRGQQIGLLAFAGKASVVCPMTTDFGFLRLILRELTPASIGLGGTRIGEAIETATRGFGEAGDINRLILLITDGEDHESFPVEAAEKAAEKGIRIVSIGFGDEAGSKIEITDPDSGVRRFLEDRQGNEVISRLDGESLREIALKTNGAYIPAGTGALDLRSIYDAYIKSYLAGSLDQEQIVVRNEAFQAAALFALICLVGSVIVLYSFSIQSAVLKMSSTFSFGSRDSASRRPQLAKSNSTPEKALPVSPKAKASAKTANIASTILLLTSAIAVGGQPVSRTIASSPILLQVDEEDERNVAPETQANTSDDSDRVMATDVAVGSTVDSEAEPTSAAKELTPREIYNDASRYVVSDPERAEELLLKARSAADVDGELRYRAVYNLGWSQVSLADRSLEEQPEESLKQLESAANYFREAIRLRPDADEARYNLEVVSKRILALTDQLAQKNEASIEESLDELIGGIRQHRSELQSLVATMATVQADLDLDRFRPMFRKARVDERQWIDRAERLIESANRTLKSLEDSADEELSAEDQLRRGQLNAMLPELSESIQWMSKARSFTRRLEPERSFLRWATSLSLAKSARDQLRNPPELLNVLIRDSEELLSLTRFKSSATANTPETPNPETPNLAKNNRSVVPKWLSAEFLTESQSELKRRIGRLGEFLKAMSQPVGDSASNNQNAQGDEVMTPSQTQERQQAIAIRALELVQSAMSAIDRSTVELEAEAFSKSVSEQAAALEDLRLAAEQFFNLRQLIETAYATEQMLLQSVTPPTPPESNSEATVAVGSEVVGSEAVGSEAVGSEAAEQIARLNLSLEAQTTNLERMPRLLELIAMEVEQVESAKLNAGSDGSESNASPSMPPNAAAPQPEISPEQLEQRLEMLNNATELAESAKKNMENALELMTERTRKFDANETLEDTEKNAKNTEQKASDAEVTDEVADINSVKQPVEAAGKADSDESSEGSNKDKAAAKDEASEKIFASVAIAVDDLDQLRRLFFTVVEQLREAAVQQTELNDASSLSLSEPSLSDATPIELLAGRQQKLREKSDAIATELNRQAEEALKTEQSQGNAAAAGAVAPPGAAPQVGAPPGGVASQEPAGMATSERFGKAAELVAKAVDSMNTAASRLNAFQQPASEPIDASATDPQVATESSELNASGELIDKNDADRTTEDDKASDKQIADGESDSAKSISQVTEPQEEALLRLLEALELLNENQDENDPQSQPQEQSGDQEEQDQQQDSESSQQGDQPSMSAERLLQAIREREAERREDQKENRVISSGTVEKDW